MYAVESRGNGCDKLPEKHVKQNGFNITLEHVTKYKEYRK